MKRSQSVPARKFKIYKKPSAKWRQGEQAKFIRTINDYDPEKDFNPEYTGY
jgi:hypothetical protein